MKCQRKVKLSSNKKRKKSQKFPKLKKIIIKEPTPSIIEEDIQCEDTNTFFESLKKKGIKGKDIIQKSKTTKEPTPSIIEQKKQEVNNQEIKNKEKELKTQLTKTEKERKFEEKKKYEHLKKNETIRKIVKILKNDKAEEVKSIMKEKILYKKAKQQKNRHLQL